MTHIPKELQSKIEWRPVPGFENYLISSLGEVYSLQSMKNLKLSTAGGYYIFVARDRNGKRRTLRVHRQAALAFGILKSKPFVNHIDGNKLNNKISNLEECTNQENILHSYRLGLQKPNAGEKSGNSKLTESDCIQILERISRGERGFELAKEYRVTKGTIYAIKYGVSWPHLNSLRRNLGIEIKGTSWDLKKRLRAKPKSESKN